MSSNNIPFDIPQGAIAVDIKGNEFHLGSVGPAFVYPLTRTVLQAQHLHSLWLRWYMLSTRRIDPNDKDVTQAHHDYVRAREIIALANKIGNE